jgi:hypothetical protein
MISSFRHEADENCALMGYYTSSSNFLPTFHNNLLVVSSLTLSLPTTTIVAPPLNVIKWQMGFNSAA